MSDGGGFDFDDDQSLNNSVRNDQLQRPNYPVSTAGGGNAFFTHQAADQNAANQLLGGDLQQ